MNTRRLIIGNFSEQLFIPAFSTNDDIFYKSEINIFIHTVQLPGIGGHGGPSAIHGSEPETCQLVSRPARHLSVRPRVI